MSSLNRARGETSLCVNGQDFTLCLTLGALAQIETALETHNLDALSERLRCLSAVDVLHVLHALLMGGGNAVSEDVLRTAKIDPTETAKAIAAAFSLSMQGT